MFVLCLSEQVVCRACSRNRYPLKYLKDRVAKVCDHCYAELRKRGESQLCISILRSCGRYHGNYFIPSLLVSTLLLMCLTVLILFLPICCGINGTVCVCVGGSVSGACGNSSPRTHRASRPLSAVFQSLQPPSLWKSRKSTSSLNQVDYISISI